MCISNAHVMIIGRAAEGLGTRLAGISKVSCERKGPGGVVMVQSRVQSQEASSDQTVPA